MCRREKSTGGEEHKGVVSLFFFLFITVLTLSSSSKPTVTSPHLRKFSNIIRRLGLWKSPFSDFEPPRRITVLPCQRVATIEHASTHPTTGKMVRETDDVSWATGNFFFSHCFYLLTSFLELLHSTPSRIKECLWMNVGFYSTTYMSMWRHGLVVT